MLRGKLRHHALQRRRLRTWGACQCRCACRQRWIRPQRASSSAVRSGVSASVSTHSSSSSRGCVAQKAANSPWVHRRRVSNGARACHGRACRAVRCSVPSRGRSCSVRTGRAPGGAHNPTRRTRPKEWRTRTAPSLSRRRLRSASACMRSSVRIAQASKVPRGRPHVAHLHGRGARTRPAGGHREQGAPRRRSTRRARAATPAAPALQRRLHRCQARPARTACLG